MTFIGLPIANDNAAGAPHHLSRRGRRLAAFRRIRDGRRVIKGVMEPPGLSCWRHSPQDVGLMRALRQGLTLRAQEAGQPPRLYRVVRRRWWDFAETVRYDLAPLEPTP